MSLDTDTYQQTLANLPQEDLTKLLEQETNKIAKTQGRKMKAQDGKVEKPLTNIKIREIEDELAKRLGYAAATYVVLEKYIS